MYSLILKQFIRSRAIIVTLILILTMGVVSIFIGRHYLLKEEQKIVEVTRQQAEHIQRNVQYHENNIGGLLYYLRFAFINKPDRLSALSIGQRDINPGVQSITIRNLEAQKYDTDLSNPANLLSGNLDLGFVIIYLIPLVIIALTFNLLSEEQEQGTWKMVATQSRSPWRFLVLKMSGRAIVIYGTVLILLLIAFLVLSLPFNRSLIAFLLISMLYLLFWFALSFAVVSLMKNSSFNALMLLSIWVVLAIVLPATANNYVAGKYPVPEALSTLIKQRDGYHRKWDLDRKQTMEKFYAHYPQFRKYGIPEGEFSYTWYYAMQQMGDDESQEDSKAMRKKILQREALSRKLSMLIPTMHTQLLLNDLAGSSLQNHIHFLDQTTVFHEKMRLYFYPKIFENSSVKNEDWESFKPIYSAKENNLNWSTILFPLLLMTLMISVPAFINMRKLRIM